MGSPVWVKILVLEFWRVKGLTPFFALHYQPWWNTRECFCVQGVGGFGESGGGQVRLGNLDSAAGYTGLPGCIHLENPEFPPPSTGSLRQWFHYFSSLQRETSLHSDEANKSSVICWWRVHVWKYCHSICPVNRTSGYITSWVEIIFPSKSHSLLHCPLASSGVFETFRPFWF